jgi:hypothetical protein
MRKSVPAHTNLNAMSDHRFYAYLTYKISMAIIGLVALIVVVTNK